MHSNPELSLSHSVLHRIVQILQLAMIMGVDIADPLTQMRLTVSDSDPSQLVMTKAYEAQFKATLDKLEQQANELMEKVRNGTIAHDEEVGG